MTLGSMAVGKFKRVVRTVSSRKDFQGWLGVVKMLRSAVPSQRFSDINQISVKACTT